MQKKSLGFLGSKDSEALQPYQLPSNLNSNPTSLPALIPTRPTLKKKKQSRFCSIHPQGSRYLNRRLLGYNIQYMVKAPYTGASGIHLMGSPGGDVARAHVLCAL